MEDLIYQEDGNYFIKGENSRKEGRSELTKWQFDAIRNLQSGAVPAVSGSLSEAAIIRLHQESDPASPFYKGPESIDGGDSELANGESESHSLYNEPTRSELEEAAKNQPESQGTTTITTEQATIPPVIEETKPAEEVVAPVPDIPETITATGNEGSTDTPPVEVEPEVAESKVVQADPEKVEAAKAAEEPVSKRKK